LTGRPSDVAGVLATGKLYTLGEQVLAFFPQVSSSSSANLNLDYTLAAILLEFFNVFSLIDCASYGCTVTVNILLYAM